MFDSETVGDLKTIDGKKPNLKIGPNLGITRFKTSKICLVSNTVNNDLQQPTEAKSYLSSV